MGTGRRPPSLLEQLVRQYAADRVGRAAFGIMLLVLLPVLVVVSIVIFGVLAAVVFGAYTLLGSPGPPVGTVFSLGWFVGGLVILFLVLRRGRRWLARLMAIADAPAALIDPPYEAEEVISEAPDPGAFHDRVAAADARLRSPSDTPDEP
jgi:hypothetical protein